ncbi:tetratricopeptide repeat protein [Chryseobacterium lathyri]|uniref:Tetratricopeptide (TPR) repeat protein n=1 Tax=Chryseobacterium lathyri TaxID=395933 RepID=A0ABT9SLG7_9FLAO|nr:tetratricopeptide repeat protein [Chryseobacterium lathyri]MDP9959832.1 tetratricopeptide (TPR) repeat protein [Chryseobacterium lathyri]
MKKLILGIAIVASAFVFGQKGDVNAKLQEANKAAMDAYNAKNYTVAAPKFLEVYNLLKTNGQDDKIYMYYAGLSYALANNSAESIKIYTDLINSGFTGVQTTYTAKEKKSGQVVNLDKATWELMKKNADYSDFKTEQTPSVEPELYETLTTLLMNAKKPNEALVIIEKGLAKFPNNAKLKEAQATAYYDSGNTEKFIGALKEQLAKNPNDATNWYNLGVMQSKNPATVEDAIASFKKAIEIKPDFDNAYQNLVYTVIGDDSKTVEQINATRKEKPEEATKLIDARRERFNKALPYAEGWYKAAPENLDALTALKEIYIVTKNTDKIKDLKAKEAELKAKAK